MSIGPVGTAASVAAHQVQRREVPAAAPTAVAAGADPDHDGDVHGAAAPPEEQGGFSAYA